MVALIVITTRQNSRRRRCSYTVRPYIVRAGQSTVYLGYVRFTPESGHCKKSKISLECAPPGTALVFHS